MVRSRRQKSGAGEGNPPDFSKGIRAMLDAGLARVHDRALTMKCVLAVAALLIVGGAQPASADPLHGAARAPIAYGTFNNSLSSKPVSSTGPKGVIDLRPGAVENASFGPALPSTAPRAAAPLTSKPAMLAQPYAGAPYQVAGKWYVPAYEPNYDEVGIASWYGPTFHGKASASGETFDEMAMTAAHPTLPIPSIVRVTNLENGKSALVRLNDRGPFVDDRIIDLSKHAGEVLGLHAKGTAKVRVQYVGPAPADGDTPVETAPAHSAQPVLVSQPVDLTPAAGPAFTATSIPSVELSPATLPSPTLDARPVAPVKTQATVQPPVSTPVSAGGFYLQAGAFADPANAEALRARLSGYGSVTVTQVQSNGRTLNRVMLGPWAARGEAEAVQSRLAETGAKSLVIARGN
jgi:rare lipoprotein A